MKYPNTYNVIFCREMIELL